MQFYVENLIQDSRIDDFVIAISFKDTKKSRLTKPQIDIDNCFLIVSYYSVALEVL